MNQALDQKIRTNAMISYFFLGWIFLLARNNADFSHPFVRSHAKTATKIHIGLLGGYLIYRGWVSGYIPGFSIPLLPTLTIDKIIGLFFFIVLAALIIRGSYLAHHGVTTSDNSSGSLKEAFGRENIALDAATETDKMIFLSSYIPLLGLVTAKKHPNPITRTGAKISALWLFVVMFLSAFGGYSEIVWIILFLYLLFVAFVGVSLFVNNEIVGFTIIEKIPNLQSTYASFRALPGYIGNFLKIIFGKSSTLDFQSYQKAILERDLHHNELALSHFTEKQIPLPKQLIFVPILNLLFLPQIFLKKNGTYSLAILQGTIMTIVLVTIWLCIGFSSPWQMFLFFPMFFGIAEVEENPFYKIPIIYELYVILDFITFGFASRVQKLKEKHKETGEKVSYKL